VREALFGSVPRAHAIVADVGGETVGLALFYYTLNTFKIRSNIFLEDLFVEPAHRGSGIGLALMRHLAQRAVAENCGRIEWRVLNWNQPSIEFYHRIGAQPIQDWHTLLLGGGALVALSEGTSHG
jgi:GNAT superfamily N-acetyltransferase